MRLLQARNYELVEANDIPVPFPQYAILSHTWISPREEITYQDIKKRKEDIENDLFKQKGWAKLKRYCDRAVKDGWEWAWMDTCCIDKSSPADTQEAINAMFRWYQSAGICYAYLEDVDVRQVLSPVDSSRANVDNLMDLDEITGRDNVADPNSFLHKALRAFLINAKWFTRGWTLQELLAPHYLVFVDRAWCRIGTRESWAAEIKEASMIEAKHLTAFRPTNFYSCSIAMRLSWASRRETTVEEDETYSLLGLFGISLPLIYGEGRWRAFNRLQRELITVYNDDSIFAWKLQERSRSPSPWPQQEGHEVRWGMLAPSIREFWDATKIDSFGYYGDSFSMTNRGLEVRAKRWRRKDDSTLCLIRLNCGTRPHGHIGIPLSHVDESYDRIRIDELCDMERIRDAEWKEEPGSEPILIRASNYSNLFAPSSLIVLEYPDLVRVGNIFFVDFGASMFDTRMQHLEQSPSTYGLHKDELFLEPNRVIFINIQLDIEGGEAKFDVIINLTERGFPSVGIMGRGQGQWWRLGAPMGEALGIYEALANHLHFKMESEPAYPVISTEETDNIVVGVHLLPRPRRPHTSLPVNAKFALLREYLLKVSVNKDHQGNLNSSERQNRKRRRDW